MNAVFLSLVWLGGFSALLMWGALMAERTMSDDD